MVVAGLHHHEQVQRVGLEAGPGRQGGEGMRLNLAGPDVLGGPLRFARRRLVEIGDQGVRRGVVQLTGKAGHLGCRATVQDHLAGLRRLQPRKAFREQGRAAAAEPSGAVAGLAVLAVERFPRRFAGLCEGAEEQAEGEADQAHATASRLTGEPAPRYDGCAIARSAKSATTWPTTISVGGFNW